jgi:hypothetical protein
MAKRLYGVDPIERFNEKYIVDKETGCWNWTGYINKFGYGLFKYEGRMRIASRVSFELFVKKPNQNLDICHSCNNRKCVNYNHLREDTRIANSHDMLNAKNQWKQSLSVDEVVEIKKALNNSYRGQVNDLAHFYKVQRQAISHIKNGTTWSHIQIP